MTKTGRPKSEVHRERAVNMRMLSEQRERLRFYAKKYGMTKTQVILIVFLCEVIIMAKTRKDGRYVYSYTNIYGKRKSIYANSLTELRKKERNCIRDREDGLDPDAADHITLNQMFDKYYAQKYNLKDSTRSNYKYMYDQFVRDTFGKRIISKIKYSDVKEFYYHLLRDEQMKPATVENVHTVIHPTLEMAVRDCILRINPSDKVMMEIKKSKDWVKKKRHALTIEQQKAFMSYVKDSIEFRGWLPILTFFLGTGCRMGDEHVIRRLKLDKPSKYAGLS